MGLYEVGAQVGGRLGSKRGLVLGLGHRSRVVRAQVLGFGLRAQLERRGAPSASRSIDAVSAGLVHLCREQSPARCTEQPVHRAFSLCGWPGLCTGSVQGILVCGSKGNIQSFIMTSAPPGARPGVKEARRPHRRGGAST